MDERLKFDEHFGVDFDDLDWEPRYNIAPRQPVIVIRRDEGGPTLPDKYKTESAHCWISMRFPHSLDQK